MLKTTQEKLPKEDTITVREWLKAPGSVIFKKLVNAQIHKNQIDATVEFTDERDSRETEGRVLMKKSLKYRHVLDVINELADPNTELYTAKIVEI